MRTDLLRTASLAGSVMTLGVEDSHYIITRDEQKIDAYPVTEDGVKAAMTRYIELVHPESARPRSSPDAH